MSRLVVRCIVLVLGILAWHNAVVGKSLATPRGELRVVDRHIHNWAFTVLNIFEHLIDSDKNGVLEPRLATDWRWIDDRTLEFSLRQGGSN